MSKQTVKPIFVALLAGTIIAGAIHVQAGPKKCATDASGKMECSMGMGMSAKKTPSPASTAARTLKIMASMTSPAKSGDNALDIVLTNAAGKPVTGAKVTAQVAMTLMDMGTASPAVTETGKGHYATTAAFSMTGPWRVTVTATMPGQKPQSKAFDFTTD